MAVNFIGGGNRNTRRKPIKWKPEYPEKTILFKDECQDNLNNTQNTRNIDYID
jgi:hypothetical protein